MTIAKWILLFWLLSLPISSFSQNSDLTGKRFSFSLHLKSLYASFDRQNEFSQPGLQFQLAYKFNQRFDLQLNGRYTRWSKIDLRAIPLQLGGNIKLTKVGNYRMAAVFKAGPEAVIGNDYAGIFANLGAGIQFSPNTANLRGVEFGINWELGSKHGFSSR